MTTPFDLAFDVRNALGEGPLWDHRVGRLVWVDIQTGLLWSGDTDGTASVLADIDGQLATVALAAGGHYLLAVDRGLTIFDPTSSTTGASLRLTGHETRCNDGAVDVAGRFWIGSMAHDHGPGRASLWCVSEGRAREVVSGVGMSNGIDWSPDHRRMYWTDTLTRRIDVFDFDADAGSATDRRPFVEVVDTDGYPDGLTVDDEGRIWVAIWDGGAVRCYDTDGSLLHHLEVPARRPTACTFGGHSLETLFVTSASNGPAADSAEAADGAVFGATGLARGLPANEARSGIL